MQKQHHNVTFLWTGMIFETSHWPGNILSPYTNLNNFSSGLANQLKTYYLHVRYLLRIQQYPVNSTYNIDALRLLSNPNTISSSVHLFCFPYTNFVPTSFYQIANDELLTGSCNLTC